jgi:hypothetical protein
VTLFLEPKMLLCKVWKSTVSSVSDKHTEWFVKVAWPFLCRLAKFYREFGIICDVREKCKHHLEDN